MSDTGYHDILRRFKRELIRHALIAAHDNRTQAARTLGLSRTYLLRLIRTLGVPR